MTRSKIPKRTVTQLHGFLHRSLTSPFSSPSPLPQSILTDQSFVEAIINAINEPVIILDTTFTIIAVNKTFLRTFKFFKKAILKQNLILLAKTHPPLQLIIKKLELLKRTKTIIEPFEFSYDFRQTGHRTLIIKGKHIAIGKYRTNFILLTLQDITQRKHLEQQKDDFIGYVSHELKTPITTASAFIQLLEGYHKKTNDVKSQFLLAKAKTQMDRLTNLLNRFSNVYKAQTGHLLTKHQKVNMSNIIHDTIETFEYTENAHTISIEGTLQHEVLGDRDKLQEVLTNLITNAMKYSPNKSKISIILEENENDVIVKVRDYGLGLSADEKEKVFERFYRVQGKRDHNIEGLGLGLYLSAAIVKEHKGKIWVESELNKGSTFSFSIPFLKN